MWRRAGSLCPCVPSSNRLSLFQVHPAVWPFALLRPALHWSLGLPPSLRARCSLCAATTHPPHPLAFLLQVYGVLPAATLFMLTYSKVSTLLSKRALFYATALPFFAFYLFFKLVMYPVWGSLHPSDAEAFAGLPKGMSYVVNLYRNWTFALFYVVSELYSSVRLNTKPASCLRWCLLCTATVPKTTDSSSLLSSLVAVCGDDAFC